MKGYLRKYVMSAIAPFVALILTMFTTGIAGSESIAPDGSARLIVERDSSSANACDIELYVQNRLAAQLGPGERAVLQVAAGEVSLAVIQASSGPCLEAASPSRPQSALFAAGQTRAYRIMQDASGLFLSPVSE